ncbi:hypothetical protein ABIA39_003470 [Nocardia sp. GAS34]|uniref:hypothetical protein n=1 Tax=unclassified Nocardia TaxID=2637762 RepID=UPI003D216A5B
MSDHLDFGYPLVPDPHGGLRSEVTGHRDAALRQLRLAGAGDDAASRLSAATVHALTALTLLIADDLEPSDTDATMPTPTIMPRSSRYSVTVSVFHNTNPAPASTGYAAHGDEVIEVYGYSDRDVPDSVSDRDIVGRVIGLFGSQADPVAYGADHRVANYLDRGNRALACGDVIAVDHRYYTLTATGLAPIGHPHMAVPGLPLPTGTTQL